MIYSTSIGLDVHARTICASALVHETGEIVRSSFGYDAAAVADWASRLPQPARAVYESGPTGFDLKRSLDGLGLPTCVGAVTKMLRPSGDRVKTDRRDADFLARMLAVGNVVECFCPTTAQEADRDLCRLREQCRVQLMRCRHQVSKLLLRKGVRWEGGTSWSRAHMEWLRALELPEAEERFVLGELVSQLEEAERRRARVDAEIARRAAAPEHAAVVAALSGLRLGDRVRGPGARGAGLARVAAGRPPAAGIADGPWGDPRRDCAAADGPRARTDGGNPQPESRNALANARMSDSRTSVFGTTPETVPAAGGRVKPIPFVEVPRRRGLGALCP